MKAIILAAGFGTRLKTLIPKSLTPIVDETTILDNQINILKEFVGIDNIIVVVGYKKELIMERFPELTYVYNPSFARTNTSKSLLCAIKKVDEDFIFVNGDTYFTPKVIELLIESKTTAFLVNTMPVGIEEVKYTVNEHGFINELSKEVENALGESYGVNFVKKSDIINLQQALEKVADQDYFEKAFENLIKAKQLEISPLKCPSDEYVKEIDFQEDLEELQSYFKK